MLVVNDIAERTGYSKKEVRKWFAGGTIPGGYRLDDYNGSWATDCEWPEVIEAINARLKGVILDDEAPGKVDWNAERAKHDSRIKAATADMREIERDEMLGKYHRAEFVRDAHSELVFAVRSAVLALPGKLAPVLASDKKEIARFAQIIENECAAMLEDLSNYEYSPDYYRERLSEVTGLLNSEDEQPTA